ncbi:MAG: hypothetical protein ACOYX1_02655 [Acidobacteriota bacterium]
MAATIALRVLGARSSAGGQAVIISIISLSAIMTASVRIFMEIVEACRRGVRMQPRSSSDKEYFAQDWFADRLREAALPFQQQGRNSYPDYWVNVDPIEGYEVKSLGLNPNGQPARTTIDFNSSIPSGRKENRNIFLVFFVYEGAGASPRAVHSVSLAHADLINCDHAVADEHINVAVHEFGSYADGFIRNRKMYVFPHPITIDPTGLGRQRLIVPVEWRLSDRRLRKVHTLTRTVAPDCVHSFTIQMRGRGEADVTRIPYANAREEHRFDVFEMA